MSELVDLGLALIAGVVVGMVLIGAWIKRGRRRGAHGVLGAAGGVGGANEERRD
jgi:hypothetical protein